MQVALFITCLNDAFLPRPGVAVVRVLEHLGHEVVFPAAQTCCGQPMYNNGQHADARELGLRMIEVFEPHDTVVTPSGSCAAMVQAHLPGLFDKGSSQRRRADALAARTHEFGSFLHSVLEVDLQDLGVRWPGPVTCHLPCHLRDIPGARDRTLALLDQIEDLQRRPLDKVEQCCGFGGTFALKYPTISADMVREKVDCIAATEANTVVCSDAGCTMHLSGACRRAGHDTAFKSLAEIIAEGLDLLETEPDRPR